MTNPNFESTEVNQASLREQAVSDSKPTTEVALDSSGSFESPINIKPVNIKALELENAQKNADAQNKIANTRNYAAIGIVALALAVLVWLTWNRDIEKDAYVKDLRNSNELDFATKQELIKQADDEFHTQSTSTFYNILIGATAYILGMATTKK